MTAQITKAAPRGERVLVEGILAELAVTDRVYFDLRHGQPLVEELLRRVGALQHSGSILVIAPNDLLPRALLHAGHDVALWTVPQATLADDLQRHTTRTGVLDDLLDGHGDGRQYDAVLLPYVLEAATDDPGAILGRLRTSLRPGGSIVLACRHSGALGARWRAARGHALLGGPNARRDHVSLSWPSLPARRVIDPAELQTWSHRAGLRPAQLGFVCDTRAT